MAVDTAFHLLDNGAGIGRKRKSGGQRLKTKPTKFSLYCSSKFPAFDGERSFNRQNGGKDGHKGGGTRVFPLPSTSIFLQLLFI